jgi:hypothetical protein
MSDNAQQETMQAFCDECVVRNKVTGRHGIEDRLEEIEKDQKQMNIKLAQMAWLVPIVTAILVALINWVPKLIDAAKAAAVTH